MTIEAPAPTSPLVLVGAATGAGAQLGAMALYQLLRVGFHLASQHTAHAGANGLPAAESADKVFGVFVLGSLLSLGPALLAGGVTGALVGALLTSNWHRMGPVKAWALGTLTAYALAALVNLVVLSRDRRSPMTYERWLSLLGYPSLLFVLVFGVVALWLYLSRAWTIRP